MVKRLLHRLQREAGFTLIELLVVVLIIGILAGIAIPAFLGQRQKAQDSAAKSMTRHAAGAAESFAVDNSGQYTTASGTAMTIADMQGIEPSLNDAGGVATVAALPIAATASSYTVTTKSKSGKYFTLTRNITSGTVLRCSGTTAPTAACTSSNW